jgi:predicted RNA binding protein YcfA (HicA-like mRNA interferase family)
VYRTGKGSHKILIHPDKAGIEIVFPDHGSDEIAKGLALRILKQAGLNKQ